MPSIHIYARVAPHTLQVDESSESRAESHEARVDAQIQKCREYAQEHFPEQMRFVRREFVSARDLRFQAFMYDFGEQASEYALSHIRDNDVILVHDVSRFSRDLERCTELLDKVSKRNIRVISATEGIDSISCREAFLAKVAEASKE